MNAGRLVAKPSRARVPGRRNGRRLATASAPVDGPGVTESACSIGVIGTLRLEARIVPRGPQRKTSL